MIPENFIVQWRPNAPWQTLAMIEQDLIISRALVELFNQPLVKTSLVFRGGTALNKLYIQPPARYSEDIDLVQIKAEPIGKVINAIRMALDSWLGEPKRKLTERSAKLIYRYSSIDGSSAKLKIEINTTEHFNVQPLHTTKYSVNSEWFEGSTNIVTYQLEELMGTKLRALYQRRKGRDLFDLWYVADKKFIDTDLAVSIFTHYCKHNNEPITRAMFEQSMHLKKQHADFQSDISPLLVPEISWDFSKAIHLVEKIYIETLKGEAWKAKG
jgi:predicted nucleotidyltransferase component of viral defense system